ncbi:MAG: alpha-ribazole phosphatase [Desulfosarcina sp.]|nr:alpha-ribazole phosphatase [Desulfosarcina sp.]MBC2767105.1 alpha-ribazole phosphatase [Desulfosarcina sp.]
MRNILKTWLFAGSEKKILLLRHGEVQAETDEKRFIGQVDLPLSDMGRHQAQCWWKCLSDAPLERIISSDLSRCMETARIIAAHRSMNVAPLAGLREINLGQWDGMSFRKVKERWPDAFQKRGMEIARFRPPEGESFLDLQQRVVSVFEKAVDQTGKNILIVAHAGVNRMILCHLLGMPPENLFRIAQGWGAMNLIDRQFNKYSIFNNQSGSGN